MRRLIRVRAPARPLQGLVLGRQRRRRGRQRPVSESAHGAALIIIVVFAGFASGDLSQTQQVGSESGLSS
jgi:hypothetical protein